MCLQGTRRRHSKLFANEDHKCNWLSRAHHRLKDQILLALGQVPQDVSCSGVKNICCLMWWIVGVCDSLKYRCCKFLYSAKRSSSQAPPLHNFKLTCNYTDYGFHGNRRRLHTICQQYSHALPPTVYHDSSAALTAPCGRHICIVHFGYVHQHTGIDVQALRQCIGCFRQLIDRHPVIFIYILF